MDKTNKLKLFIGIFYIILVSSFLIFIFSNFSYEEIASYKFIQLNREYLVGLKTSNLFILGTIFFLLTVLWVFLLGFGSPIGLLAGFIFGKYLGTFIAVLGCTLGATFLYVFGSYFLKDIIKHADSLKKLVIAILKNGGSNNKEAQTVLEHIVRLNLDGRDSHGVGILPT